jgi:hypothetical protein
MLEDVAAEASTADFMEALTEASEGASTADVVSAVAGDGGDRA